MSDTFQVCHVPPVTPSSQPGPLSIPSVPPAQPNIQSLTQTVNQLRQVVMILAGQQATNGTNGQNGASAKSGSYTEVSRVTSKVKIYQNNDPTTGNFVEVDQINTLVMGSKATGQTWTWNRGS